jgi:hypothetical protein
VVTGPPRLHLEPGTLVVATHRRETDVPVLCPPLYTRARLWHDRTARGRLSFAARDDLFLRGFFAGFPHELGPRGRRALYPLDVGGWLPLVHVHRLRSATSARLVEALGERRGTPLAAALEPAEVAAFAERARRAGLRAPHSVDDVLRGEYADLLWRVVTPKDPVAPATFWSRRAAAAALDFRSLVELLRAGGRLLVFPEGRPSPDGTIGPVQRGLGALVRRGRPRAILPLAGAYDPLVRGRTRVVVRVGEPAPAPAEDVEGRTLGLLRRSLPLTAGQIVAAGVDARRAVDDARSDGRPIDPRLLKAADRRRALAEAAREAKRARDALPYLRREYESARL